MLFTNLVLFTVSTLKIPLKDLYAGLYYKVYRASGERLDYGRAKTLMTRPMLTRGTMKEALQDVTKVSIDVRKGEDDLRDDNPSVMYKWPLDPNSAQMGCTLMG